MTTPNDVQNKINATSWANGKGLITGTALSVILTGIVTCFVLYAPLASPALTGTPTINGAG